MTIRTWLVMFCCWPLVALAQLPGRPDDSLRKTASITRFPSPFTLSENDAATLSGEQLLNSCASWLMSVKDSLPAITIQKDKAHHRVIATNVPATADISYTIRIQAISKGYRITLQDYIFHTVNSKQLPVEQAARIKEYKETVNVERVLILHNYRLIFKALKDYLKQHPA